MQIPKHIAIIMDGNRRWAKQKGLPSVAGHQKVANELLEQLVEHAADRGISYITFWAWSTENWRRNPLEVKAIMQVFKGLLARNIKRLHEKGIRLNTIGDLSKFPKEIKEGVEKGIAQTKNNTRITATFALNYGGRDEIVRAIKKLPENFQLTNEEFGNYLDTAGMPDPELIIRTGGEKRLSGFMLWQSEYAELYFTDVLMPDFTSDELDKALADFGERQRRFGK